PVFSDSHQRNGNTPRLEKVPFENVAHMTKRVVRMLVISFEPAHGDGNHGQHDRGTKEKPRQIPIRHRPQSHVKNAAGPASSLAGDRPPSDSSRPEPFRRRACKGRTPVTKSRNSAAQSRAL